GSCSRSPRSSIGGSSGGYGRFCKEMCGNKTSKYKHLRPSLCSQGPFRLVHSGLNHWDKRGDTTPDRARAWHGSHRLASHATLAGTERGRIDGDSAAAAFLQSRDPEDNRPSPPGEIPLAIPAFLRIARRSPASAWDRRIP